MSKDIVVGYSTRYALTKGVLYTKARTTSYNEKVYCFGHLHTIGKDFFLTKEEAIRAQQSLARRKIVSCRREIAWLESLLDGGFVVGES